jgi:hypothetical protein
MVFSTALSPAAMGLALDAGLTIETIVLLCLVWVAVGTALVPLAVRRAAGRTSAPPPGAPNARS